jgi:hypothetical protein
MLRKSPHSSARPAEKWLKCKVEIRNHSSNCPFPLPSLPMVRSWLPSLVVAQHLHSMILHVSYDDVACTVKRDAAGAVELTRA